MYNLLFENINLKLNQFIIKNIQRYQFIKTSKDMFFKIAPI